MKLDHGDRERFSLLRNKEIIYVLDGDSELGSFEYELFEEFPLRMPYLSGADICSIAKRFGSGLEYGGGMSRWEYMDILLEYCIDTKQCNDLLRLLFSKKQFSKSLSNFEPNKIELLYTKIKMAAIDKINTFLYFDDYELILANGYFSIRELGQEFNRETPTLKKVDREYIKELPGRAYRDIQNCEFDSALTKSRTLIEEVFYYMLEKKGEEPNDSGNIEKLYAQVKKAYNMCQNNLLDKRVNELLSGLNKIVKSISSARNNSSDSHGVGMKRISIAEHHARLFVNSAVTLAEFMLSVEKKANK